MDKKIPLKIFRGIFVCLFTFFFWLFFFKRILPLEKIFSERITRGAKYFTVFKFSTTLFTNHAFFLPPRYILIIVTVFVTVKRFVTKSVTI